MARVNLSQDHLLWQVGVPLNMLLLRLHKTGREANRIEMENQQLKRELAEMSSYMREAGADRHLTPHT
jgi:hypothetical protein